MLFLPLALAACGTAGKVSDEGVTDDALETLTDATLTQHANETVAALVDAESDASVASASSTADATSSAADEAELDTEDRLYMTPDIKAWEAKMDAALTAKGRSMRSAASSHFWFGNWHQEGSMSCKIRPFTISGLGFGTTPQCQSNLGISTRFHNHHVHIRYTRFYNRFIEWPLQRKTSLSIYWLSTIGGHQRLTFPRPGRPAWARAAPKVQRAQRKKEDDRDGVCVCRVTMHGPKGCSGQASATVEGCGASACNDACAEALAEASANVPEGVRCGHSAQQHPEGCGPLDE